MIILIVNMDPLHKSKNMILNCQVYKNVGNRCRSQRPTYCTQKVICVQYPVSAALPTSTPSIRLFIKLYLVKHLSMQLNQSSCYVRE